MRGWPGSPAQRPPGERPGLGLVLVALVLTAVLPVTGLTVDSALDDREETMQRVGEEAARLGRLAALREADLVAGGREVLVAIAGSVPIDDPSACSSRLDALLPLYPRFANIGVVGPDGGLLCSAIVPATPLNFSDRAWFQRAVSTQSFAVGDYQTGRITGRPSLVFGLPLVIADEIAGVAWAALDLGWLQQFAAQVELPGEPALSVIDRTGTILARLPDPERWVGRRLEGFPTAFRRDDERVVETEGVDGIKRVYAFTALGDPEDPHAVVAVGIPTSAVYGEANRALRRELLLLAVIALLGVGAARFVADRLVVRPARALVEASTALASGDLASRVGPTRGSRELGQASRAFDDMAAALQSRDVELRRAVEEQRRSEARFQQLLDGAPDAIVGIDRDGVIRLVNRQAEVLFGWTREEMLSRPVEVLAPDVGQTYLRAFGRTTSGDRSDLLGRPLPVTGRRKDGSSFPAEVALAALETDDGIVVSAAVRDVSERRRAEEELARSREQLQAIVDNAPTSIYMKDVQGRYVLVNRHFEMISGVGREDVRGRTAREVFGAEVGAELEAHDRLALAGGEPVTSEEVVPLEDGPHTFISLKFPLFDRSGEPYAVCGVSTDITERIQAQAERQALEARLQQSQRLESLGQLAGGVAHDFNNLLAVILNYADFVLEEVTDAELGPEAAESVRSDVTAIRRAGEAAAALTRQLLIFGRRDTVQPRTLDLGDVVRNLEPLMRRALGEDLTLVLDLAPGLWSVRADPGRLEQVLVNLVVNARDAMEPGGRVTVTTANVEVSAGEALPFDGPPGRYVRLAVSDTGTGMEPEVQARAFEPFYTTKPKGQGTGLGLATVFGIVTEAGGHISLESQPGAGTTVLIHLSAAEAETGGAGTPGRGASEDRFATILVVEDEDPVREVARRMLSGRGHRVLVAGDADEALALCRDHEGPIDLVLTDVVMPGLSGPELVERARALRPGLRAVYMSGYPEDFLARRHSVDEDVRLIGKPFTAETLLRSVHLALEQS